jgi:hypothetical protein
MKLPAWAWLIVGGAASVAIVAACVGDDPVSSGGIKPDESIQKGRQGGRCDEGRCLSGLYCDTLNDVCLLDADAGDGGSSSSGGSSGASSSGGLSSSGGSSGTTNPCPFDAGPSNTKRCLVDGGACPALCCLSQDQSTCQVGESLCLNQSGGGKPLHCIGAGTCGTGQSCCLDANFPLDAGACNTFSYKELSSTKCYDAGTCPGTTTAVCGDDTECVSPKRCVKLTVTGGGAGASVALGTCL